MKKLILILVVLNVVLYAWFRMNPVESEPQTVRRGDDNVPLLILVDELSSPPSRTEVVDLYSNNASRPVSTQPAPMQSAKASGSPAPETARPADVAAKNVVAPPKPSPLKPAEKPAPNTDALRCFTLGAFSDESVASKTETVLKNQGATVNRREQQQQISGAYWVYLPSYPNRETAQEASRVLSENGVKDYFIITDDENLNGISLGLYSKKDGSERRRAEIASLGFQPLVSRKERQRVFWWLDYQESKPIAAGTYRIDEASADVKRQPLDCKVFAKQSGEEKKG